MAGNSFDFSAQDTWKDAMAETIGVTKKFVNITKIFTLNNSTRRLMENVPPEEVTSLRRRTLSLSRVLVVTTKTLAIDWSILVTLEVFGLKSGDDAVVKSMEISTTLQNALSQPAFVALLQKLSSIRKRADPWLTQNISVKASITSISAAVVTRSPVPTGEPTSMPSALVDNVRLKRGNLRQNSLLSVWWDYALICVLPFVSWLVGGYGLWLYYMRGLKSQRSWAGKMKISAQSPGISNVPKKTRIVDLHEERKVRLHQSFSNIFGREIGSSKASPSMLIVDTRLKTSPSGDDSNEMWSHYNVFERSQGASSAEASSVAHSFSVPYLSPLNPSMASRVASSTPQTQKSIFKMIDSEFFNLDEEGGIRTRDQNESIPTGESMMAPSETLSFQEASDSGKYLGSSPDNFAMTDVFREPESGFHESSPIRNSQMELDYDEAVAGLPSELQNIHGDDDSDYSGSGSSSQDATFWA
jgi:hypothetical protein